MTWGIWWIIMEAVASLKMCTLMYYFSRKYIMFEPKKYRGVMFHNTEEWCNIWGGTDLCFEKWHEEFGEFWHETRKSQNLHFNGLLLTKVFELKNYRGACVMTLKCDAIFKEKLTGCFKNDIRSLFNIHARSCKSENLHFAGLVMSKAYKVSDEKVQKSYVSWHFRVIQTKANSWQISIFYVIQ